MSKASAYMYIAVIRNHLSEITPANRNRLGRNLTRRRWSRYHAPLQTFGALYQRGTKWRRKKCIFANFLSPKQRIVSPTSRRPVSVTFEHKTQIGMVVIPTEQNCKIFAITDPKTSILGFFSAHPLRTLRFRANLSIASYSRMAKGVSYSQE